MRHAWLSGEGHCHDVFHPEILTQERERLDVELNYTGFRGGEFLNVELSQKDSRTKTLIRIPVSLQHPRHFQPLLCSPEVIQPSRRLGAFTRGKGFSPRLRHSNLKPPSQYMYWLERTWESLFFFFYCFSNVILSQLNKKNRNECECKNCSSTIWLYIYDIASVQSKVLQALARARRLPPPI